MTEEERRIANERIWGKDGKSCDHEMLDIYAKKAEHESDQKDLAQCYDLMAAGWVVDYVGHRPMSHYWRAPAKGKRPKGRRYLSTNQAWRAMQRTAGNNPDTMEGNRS